MSKIVRALNILSVFFVANCASVGAVVFSSQNYPLKVLQNTASQIMPGGKRKVSVNEREFYSEYFFPKGNARFWAPPKVKNTTRYYAVIKILGDQRPYNVEVSVVKEVYKSAWGGKPQFVEEGVNRGATQEFANYYQEMLAKSLKDRNVVDDFRVF